MTEQHSASPDAEPVGHTADDTMNDTVDDTMNHAMDDAADDTMNDAADGDIGDPSVRKKRRRGSRGGRNRKPARSGGGQPALADDDQAAAPESADVAGELAEDQPELPDRPIEGKVLSPQVAAEALVPRRPQIGDTRPAPPVARPAPAGGGRGDDGSKGGGARNKSRGSAKGASSAALTKGAPGDPSRKRRTRGGRGKERAGEAELLAPEEAIERRRGRERNGRPIGRYLMCVQVRENLTQVAVLEGRSLIEHYVSRPSDDISQIHGSIYLGRVQNVLPGMEAAFVDIATPKNAVLYRGDVQYDAEDIVEGTGEPRIEQILRARQMIVCQVTKNPIGAKGARLTQEISLPGRFVVLIPNSRTYGISKRLPDDERKRLRAILDRVKPAEHGLIVRTAAEDASEHELRADITRLLDEWTQIEKSATSARVPTLLYREPELAVRVIREEFNADYRGIVIDDPRLHQEVESYVRDFNPELADRVELYDADAEGLPLFVRFHIHEQIHKALDRKVWLPSGGSLIIEHTEALTVIDVNTGKNVGTSNLEATVFHNNLEAAEEVARQLRLRDIGGIIVIDFIDMEVKENRRRVVDAFRDALARDKTRTQVFDISDLGLVEMTRKRIGEGLLTNFSEVCPECEGRGVTVDHRLLE